MKPSKPADEDNRANRRLLWTVFFGALAFGLILGVGAFLQDPRRGAIVFATVLTLTGLWALALLRFGRRRQ